jgi:glycosyltransferase involved in cell wall biosynthesis
LINSDFDTINKITVVILSRNHEKFISDCLHSVHRELPDARIVISDTSSTNKCHDLGKSIVEALKLNAMHIKLNKNTKTLSALKNLEKYICTKYIVLLSADDALGGNYRNALISLLKTGANSAVFNFTSVITDQNLKPLRSRKPQWSEQNKKNKRKLSYSNPGTAPGALIPWTVLSSSPAWKEPPAIVIEDYWIWWQLIDLVPFVNCFESNVLYRQHLDNISKASKNEDYAYSLGYTTAIPNIKAINLFNKFLSLTLIFRWIRHLNFIVWCKFFAGYFESKRKNQLL